MAVRRIFGIVDDATVGGTPYDTLVAGAIPDATIFWPVTTANVNKNNENSDRNDEVVGRRANRPPRPFKAAPEVTLTVPAYFSVLKKLLRKCLGGTDALSGTPPAAVTHNLQILAMGAGNLPAVHAQVVRDDANHKVAGCSVNSISLDLPLDGEGSVDSTLHGLYHKHDPAAAPTAAYTGLTDDVLMLRDASGFAQGSATAIPDLQGMTFSFDNNLRPEWFAGKNVVSQALGGGAGAVASRTYKRWFPGERRIGSAQTVRWSLRFGNVNTAQDLAHDFAQVEKFVFEVAGNPLGTTPAATELLRITIYNGVLEDGGPEALTARDDITASYEGGAYWSDTDSLDVKVEMVDNVNVAIT